MFITLVYTDFKSLSLFDTRFLRVYYPPFPLIDAYRFL